MLDRGGYRDSPFLGRPAGFRRPLTTVLALILIHAAVFAVQILTWAIARVDLAYYLGVRAELVVEELQVWRLVTYMLPHDPGWILHIVFNLYVLYAFGTPLEAVLGRRRFLTVYVGGGVAGGLAYCVMQYLPGVHAIGLGASAGVMAIVILFAIHYPNQMILLFFLIPIRIKWAAALIVGIDVLGAIGATGGDVAHSAHLGGALFAFLYWRTGHRVAGAFHRIEQRQRQRDARRRHKDDQRLDQILAKITREGFDSLTPRERRFLNEQSRQRRRDR